MCSRTKPHGRATRSGARRPPSIPLSAKGRGGLSCSCPASAGKPAEETFASLHGSLGTAKPGTPQAETDRSRSGPPCPRSCGESAVARAASSTWAACRGVDSGGPEPATSFPMASKMAAPIRPCPEPGATPPDRRWRPGKALGPAAAAPCRVCFIGRGLARFLPGRRARGGRELRTNVRWAAGGLRPRLAAEGQDDHGVRAK